MNQLPLRPPKSHIAAVQVEKLSMTVAGAPPQVLPLELDDELLVEEEVEEPFDPDDDELDDESPPELLDAADDEPAALPELAPVDPDDPPPPVLVDPLSLPPDAEAPAADTQTLERQESPALHVPFGKQAHRASPVQSIVAPCPPLHADAPVHRTETMVAMAR